MQIAPWVFPLTEETASVPPHVRGKAFLNTGTSSAPGITPACAGKRAGWPRSCRRPGDHPRVCGEKFLPHTVLTRRWGSPPRVRGKVGAAGWRRKCTGITPACAGKSRYTYPVQRRSQDHPRVCGEKAQYRQQRRQRRGSPPRVRGKGMQIYMDGDALGITPACAGKSYVADGHAVGRRDHPRVCGEKSRLNAVHMGWLGSPPRVRGKGRKH